MTTEYLHGAGTIFVEDSTKKYRVCAPFPWRRGWVAPNETLYLSDCEAQHLLRVGRIEPVETPKNTRKKEAKD